MGESSSEELQDNVDQPITEFLPAWWEFLKLASAKPRGNQNDYLGWLRRMGLSRDRARAFTIAGCLGTMGLVLYFLDCWDGWMKDHGVLMGSRVFHRPGNLLGSLFFLAVILLAHVVVSYFLALTWYFVRADDSGTRQN